MNSKNIQIIINISIIILEIIGFILVIQDYGIYNLEYYTEDSNFLLLLSSILILIYLTTNKGLPSWLKSFRFIAVVSTTLTFIIVLTVLSWASDMGLYTLLFYRGLFYHHTICPILAIISFSLIEKYDNLKAIQGTYFTIIYALILIPLNILKIVNGPYPFLRVYEQPILQSVFWIVIIFAIVYLIALILKKVNGKVII